MINTKEPRGSFFSFLSTTDLEWRNGLLSKKTQICELAVGIRFFNDPNFFGITLAVADVTF